MPVSQNDIAQALSRTLIEVSRGHGINRTKLEKQIDISDAINRRLQVQINMIKTQIEAKKHGIDFAASMKEVRQLTRDVSGDMGQMDAE